MSKKERVTVDFDEECYYLDDEFWISWDKFGEDMADTINDLLNEQEELIKRLKTIREEQTETILKQKRKIKELETRNKRQYNRLKELTELMYEKQWGKLENMVEEWEKQDELLEQEWGTYYEDK